jgi:hypothetical protein
MDDVAFDRLARRLAAVANRRTAARTLAALGATVLGARAVEVVAEEVEPAGGGCQGKRCNSNKNCGKGLICGSNGKCQYKNGNKGGKGDTCCRNSDCKKRFACTRKNTCK